MSRFTIYSTTGTAKTEVEVLELHDEWMAECFVTVTVKSEEPIDFVIGDYIIYRDEKYAIDYDPTVIKKARRGSYGEGFVYDNIKFAHDAQSKIVRCDFTDIVLSPDSETNKIHYSSLPTFPFYCASVDDLLDRVQACLEELYPGQFVIIGLNSIRNKERGQAVGRRQEFIDAYKKYIDPAYIPSGQEATDPYGKQDVAETVDNISCWDALVKIHDDFDLNFIQRGYVIVAGTNGALTASTFRYGKGNGLYELERISDSSKQIVTRLRGYGNETNLPSRYYATLNMQVFANALVAANGMVTVNLKYRTDYFLEVSPAGESFLTTKIGDTEYPNSVVRINGLDGNVIVDTRTSVPIAAGTKIYFLDNVKKDAFPTENRDYATNNLPDNMAVSRLMLPGFPNQSLADWVEAHKDDADKDWLRAAITAGFEFSTNQYRPYIDSPNKEEYEIRPASIYFDGSDETDDIYPTIEEMEYQGHRIDQVVEAEQITDNGVFTKEGDIPNFKITLPDLGFNLLEYYEDGASIDMKSGMCGARSFEFAKKPTRDAQTGHWICTVKRVHDDALDLWFPYNDFQIRPNDKYVLIGIDMPDAYVNAASVKLLKASLEALDENDEPQYTYQPRIDEIWMQRQHNNSIGSAITSIHDTIKAGDIFQFEDADLGVSDGIIIDVLTIKENGNNGIPTYEVTLRNEKQVSTIQKAVEKAVSGSSAVSGSAGGYSGRQVYNAIENYGSEFFLSKNTDDVANGEIGFLKGLWIKVKGLFGISEDGNALLHDADMSGKVHVGEDLNVEGEILGTSAVLDEIRSSEYTGDGMLDTGYKLWYEEGRAKLVIDDLVARGKFTVNELEARKWTYAGGNMVFSGAGSTLFFVEYLDANENTLGYTNINAPWLLAGRPLLSAMVAWSKRRTVKRQLTDAEKAQVVKFRCYEYSDDGTMQTRNWWHVNDIAMCETLNKVKDKANSDGSYSGYASNTVYKRRVAGIGSKEIAVLNDGRVYDYVDLWNIYNVQGQTYINSQGQEATITDNVKGFLNMAPSGQTPSTDWPAAGDVIVQCGNPLDTDRQAVVTIEVQGTLHGFKVYDTINDYSMANKEWVEIGYDQTTGKAKSNIYGDFRFGCRENEEQNGGSYVKYNRTTKRLDIKARIEAGSTLDENVNIGAKTFDDYVDDLIHDITDDIQGQVDQKAETWYQNTNPATAWTTDEERNEHVGDLWYCTEDIPNTLYKKDTTWYYRKTTSEGQTVYVWVQQNIPQSVFDTMDGKASVFISRPDTVRDDGYCYRKNDMWVLAAQITLHGVTYKQGELLMATADSETFVEAHWVKKVIYTDDSYATNFVNITYAADKENLQNQIDGKYETWFYEGVPTLNNLPASEWTTAALKEEHVGDLYWDKTNENAYRFIKTVSGDTTTYSWSQIGDSSVITAMAQAADAQDTADGKRRVFTSTPTVPYDVGDLWAEGPTGDIKKCKTAKTASQSYDAADWEKASKYTDDSTFNNWKAAEYTETIGGLNTGIGEAKDAAQAARDAANDAQADATAANTKLSVWANDGKISPTEIRALENEEVDVKKEYIQICNEADKYSVTKAAFTTAYNAAISAFDYHTDLDNAGDDGCIDVITDSTSQYYYGNISAYYAARQTILDAIATATKNAVDAAAAAFSNDPAYQAITGALDGTTVTEGGLMLSSLIALRKYNGSGDIHELSNYTTWSGMSGVYDDRTVEQGGAKGHGIAAWYGGDMLDLQDGTYDPTKRYAKSLFRFDGSGYLSSGLISWDDEGVLTAANFSGVTTQLGTILVDGVTITAAQMANLKTMLDMFELDTTTVSGTTLIKAKYSLYSVGDVSALGNSSGGGGGGGGGASVLYELNDVLANAGGTSVLDAQAGYVLTCVENGGSLKWKAAPTAPTYVLPQATSGALGGIKIGYTDATVGTRNYAVALDNDGKAYVNVPWEDHTYTLAGLMGSSAKGGTTQPIYWDGTEFKNTTYTLAKSVPDDAVFTDHYDWNDITSKPSFDYLPLAGGEMSGSITVKTDKGISIGSASARVYYEYVYRILGVQSISASTNGTNVLSLPSKAGTLAVTDDIAWSNVSSKPSNIFCYQGEVSTAYVNGTTYSTLDSGTYYIQYSGSSGSLIHFQHGGSASGLDIKFDYTQDSNNPLYYRKTIDSNRFASTDWVALIDSLNIGSQSVNYATSAGDADTCDSLHVHSGRNNEANKIVRTDASGYIQCGYINSSSGDEGNNSSPSRVWGTNGTDSYLRTYLTSALSVGSAASATKASQDSDGNTINSTYLKKSGGTMTGSITAGTDSIIKTADGKVILHANDSYTILGYDNVANQINTYVDGYNVIIRGGSSHSELARFNSSGYMGIGTSSPSYKLHVSGDIYATGDVTADSDATLKTIMSNADLRVEQIANAPAVKFTWNDKRDDKVHTGTIAQYWQKILPECINDKSGTLSMNYGAAAMVSVINVAKEVVDHEERIEELERENERLRQELRELKSA